MTDEQLDIKLKELEELQKSHLDKAMSMTQADNSNLFPLDFLGITVYKRSMALISGFCLLIRNKNFICAAPLVRLQLDNALRFYATTLVAEPHKLAIDFIGGIAINKFTDENTGKRLYDHYLVEKLNIHFNWLKRVYEQTSGYIHLSDKQFSNATIVNDTANMGFAMTLSAEDSLITNKERIEAANAMISITKIVLWLLDSWTYNKDNPGLKQQL